MVALSSSVALSVENGPQALSNNIQFDGGNLFLEGSVMGYGISDAYAAGSANNLTINGSITLDGSTTTTNLWMLSPALITTNGAVGEQNAVCSIVKTGDGIWQADGPILVQGSVTVGNGGGAVQPGDAGALILGGSSGPSPTPAASR